MLFHLVSSTPQSQLNLPTQLTAQHTHTAQHCSPNNTHTHTHTHTQLLLLSPPPLPTLLISPEAQRLGMGGGGRESSGFITLKSLQNSRTVLRPASENGKENQNHALTFSAASTLSCGMVSIISNSSSSRFSMFVNICSVLHDQNTFIMSISIQVPPHPHPHPYPTSPPTP